MALSEELTEMLNTAVIVLGDANINDDTVNAAEDCIQSLLKSMAVLGYELVKDNNG